MHVPRSGKSSARPESEGPLRTCVGCGRQAPKHELLRFVASDGVLAPSATHPGRGAYTCRRLSCFERAASKKAFSRTLKRTVRVDPTLAHLYTDR
jgi:uncharacterized protein